MKLLKMFAKRDGQKQPDPQMSAARERQRLIMESVARALAETGEAVAQAHAQTQTQRR